MKHIEKFAVVVFLLLVAAFAAIGGDVIVQDGKLNVTDSADNKAIYEESGDKVCLNGAECTAYIYYNGSAVVIESP